LSDFWFLRCGISDKRKLHDRWRRCLCCIKPFQCEGAELQVAGNSALPKFSKACLIDTDKPVCAYRQRFEISLGENRAMRSSRSHGWCSGGLSTIRKLGARSSLHVAESARQPSLSCQRTSLWLPLSPNYSCTFGYTFGYRHQFGLFTFDSAKSLMISHLDR